MHKIIIYKILHQTLYEFLSIFVVLDFSSNPPELLCLLLMQRLRDDGDADAARAPGPPAPTTHQTAYISSSINEEIHHVQHCSSESVLYLTTFGVLGIHARQQHHGPPSLIRRPPFCNHPRKTTFTSFPSFHSDTLLI